MLCLFGHGEETLLASQRGWGPHCCTPTLIPSTEIPVIILEQLTGVRYPEKTATNTTAHVVSRLWEAPWPSSSPQLPIFDSCFQTLLLKKCLQTLPPLSLSPRSCNSKDSFHQQPKGPNCNSCLRNVFSQSCFCTSWLQFNPEHLLPFPRSSCSL